MGNAKPGKDSKQLSHYDANGRASMVDVSGKAPTVREAEASAFVAMSRKVLRALPQNPKGDPLEVARIAGIQAAKRTAELIPMCHPIPLSKVEVEVELQKDGIAIRALARTKAETEWRWKRWLPPLSRHSPSTICARRWIRASRFATFVLLSKSGGKSGDYHRGSSRSRRAE